MQDKIQILLERFVDNISKSKIEEFCNFLENSNTKFLYDYVEMKKHLHLNSNEEMYFINLLENFTNRRDLILLIKFLIENKNLKNQIQKNTSLAWSGPIKYHEKINQTSSVFLRMINEAKTSIVFVGYAMIEGENKYIFDALRRAAKERDVKIKIIFDKADRDKKWGKWTGSPKKIIENVWGDIEYFPRIYSYDDKRSSLHAKFLIVDEIEIFVTSANMTDRAMTRNLEMGIAHYGYIAKHASEMIELLIKERHINEVKYV